jgi:hypothetical protein
MEFECQSLSTTPQKQAILYQFLLEWSLRTGKEVYDQNIIYVDTNAGSAWYTPDNRVGIVGSPIIASTCFKLLDLQVKSICFEKEPEYAKSLNKCIKALKIPNMLVVNGSNTQIKNLKFGKDTIGLIYNDPISGIDLNILEPFHKNHPNVDILVNLGCAGAKRNGNKPLVFFDKFNISNWYIENGTRGKAQFSLFFGSNKDWNLDNFNHVQTEQGQKLITKLNHTNKQLAQLHAN